MTQTSFSPQKPKEEPRARMWFSKSTDGQHTIAFCLKCQRQRTFSSISWHLFKCDHCGTKMRYDEYQDRMILE
jgi:ribosomal protein L37AE/L43A